MRLTTVILIASLMQVSASTLAQKITLSKTNAPLKTILQELRQQSGYLFLYSDNVLKLGKPVDIEVNQEDFNEVLEKVFANQPLTYSINKKTIVIKEKVPSFLGSLAEHRANLTVRGRVVDENARPLASASIQVKGKTQVYMSNEKGEFEIKGVEEDAVFVVSYVGYKSLEIPLKGAVMPLEIKLNEQTGELQEVKVVYNTGYQELNKERSTGSFVQIDNELFNRSVGTNVLDRILNVTNGLINNPIGGGGLNIIIRGYGTINASTNPLIVVDNFPYEGDLNNLNPNDVESITVLKDAAAASIWGVRAGNGVIVIVTKKGKFNQVNQLGFNSNVSVLQKPNLFYIPYMSSKDIIDFEKKQFETGMYNVYDDFFPSFKSFPLLPQSIEVLLAARKQNKGTQDYNALDDPSVNETLDKLSKHDVRNDIDRYLLQKGINQQYALNFSGGNNNFNYYASLGYDKNSNNNVKDKYDRLSIDFNNTWIPIKNLEINSSINHTKSTSTNAGIDYRAFLPHLGLSPYTMFADKQGKPLTIPWLYRTAYIDTANYPGLLDWHYRPLEDYNFIDNQSHQYDTRLSAILNYKIMPGLKVELQYQNQIALTNGRRLNEQGSFEIRNNINRSMNRNSSGQLIYPYPLGDVLDLSNSKFKAWNIRGSLRFDQNFGNHNLSIFAGMELRETNTETNSNTLYGYDPETYTSKQVNPTQSYPARPNGSISIGSIRNPLGNLTRNGSFFGNGAYNYKGKYIATVSGRIDQSNFFGVKANLRRVPLWSVGTAWNLHMEDFYNTDWLSILKIKTSYGYTGNTNSGVSSYPTFRYLPTTNNTGAPLMSDVIFGEILTPNNPQLRWERIKIFNVGIDFSLKNSVISGSIELYKKDGLDLIGPIIKDPTTGVLTFTGNRASMSGKGIDITLNTRNIKNESFEWSTDWLFSHNRDKVTAYEGFELLPYDLAKSSGIVVGSTLNGIYSFKWAGLDPVNGSPRIYIADTISNSTNISKIKREDLIFNGQRNPKFFGSFRNTFKYKHLSFSANITYQFGHYFRASSIDYNNLLTNGWIEHKDYLSRWQVKGDELYTNVPSIPIANDQFRNEAYLYSNVLVEKADHIRLQDIRLDYRFEKDVFKKMHFKQISIYMFAQNLGIIWRANKKRLDPTAASFGSIPASKIFTFGMNANF